LGFAKTSFLTNFFQAIVAGVSIILVIGVIFIIVGLLTADPGKDSIIYRMTTTRMKKD
jgi:renin receptor